MNIIRKNNEPRHFDEINVGEIFEYYSLAEAIFE